MWTLSTKCIWFSLWSKLFLLRLPTGTKSSFPSSLNHSLEIEAIFVQSRPRHTVLTAESFTSHHYYDDYQWASLLTWHLAGQPHLLLRHDLCSRTGGSTWRAVNEKTDDVVVARRTVVDAPDQGAPTMGCRLLDRWGATMWPVRQIVSSRQPLCSSRVLRSSTCCYGRGKGNLS